MPDSATSTDPAVQAQLDRLTMLSPGRDVLGLERITALMDRLGNPHRSLPPVFHVAGTNGKGSTCAFLRAMLEAAGHRVHVYTSPHLVRFNERIRVVGKLIDDAELAPLLAEVLDCSADIAPSFFEATTAAAFLAFARTPADACVIEVGLGGRLDATNVIERPLVCGVAQIGIDHEAFLLDPTNGPDWPPLERIAWEKAGIAKRGVPLVCLAQTPEAEARIIDHCREAGARLLLENRDWVVDANLKPSLPGAHQHRNANLAVMLARQFGVDEPAISKGIVDAFWPARLQRLAPGPFTGEREVWLDGAHNEAAGATVASFIDTLDRPRHLITGVLANKDARGLLSHFAGKADRLTAIPVPGHPHHQPEMLAAIARDLGIEGGIAAGPAEALALSDAPVTVFVVSLYLAGEVLRLNDQLLD